MNIRFIGEDGSELRCEVEPTASGEAVLQQLINERFIPALQNEQHVYTLTSVVFDEESQPFDVFALIDRYPIPTTWTFAAAGVRDDDDILIRLAYLDAQE